MGLGWDWSGMGLGWDGTRAWWERGRMEPRQDAVRVG